VRRRFAFGLRAKLALVALALLALPWAGVRYVNELEQVLLEGQRQALIGTARAIATALHDRPQLLVALPERDDALRREAELELQRIAQSEGRLTETAPVTLAREAEIAARAAQAEIAAILRGVQRTESRIWVVNRRYQVLALAGSLRRAEAPVDESGPLREAWQRFAGWLIQRPSEDFAEAVPDDVLATGRDIAGALQGTPGRAARTADGRAVVVSAAHPVWNRDEVAGAVVVEETTNPIASLRSEALERLLALTLTVFLGAAALLIGYATWLSHRIRRLRDEAKARSTRQDRAPAAARTRRRTAIYRAAAACRALAQYHTYPRAWRAPVARLHADRGGTLLAREPQARSHTRGRTHLRRKGRAGPGAPDHDPAAHERGDAPGAEPALCRARAL
jgi:hypothetical protein